MQKEFENYPEIVQEHDIMELFEELSLSQRIRKIIHGLKAPEYTGEHKWARLQLLRLWSPVSALVVPALMMILILFMGGVPEGNNVLPIVRLLDEPDKVILDPIEPIKPPEKTIDKKVDKLIDPTITTEISNQAKFSPKPQLRPAVAVIRSPVEMPKILGGPRTGVPGGMLTDGTISAVTEDAVLRALRWLKSVQETDGSWIQESGGGEGKGTAPAMTGLALLTFLAHGETPTSKEFGETVEQAMKWLVYNQEPDGRFKGRDGHDYSHPIAAYALCEAYWLTKNLTIKESAKKAIEVIINGQHASGGWDYNCKQSNRDDTSYMGWCAQALKAARTAGLDNPGLDKALLRTVKGFQSNAAPGGGFGYTGPQKSHLTGVGVLCMQLMGAADEAECRQGLAWLEDATLEWDKPWGKSPLYYWYYVTQAKFHASEKIWKPWDIKMKKELPGNQVIVKNADTDKRDMGYWEPCNTGEHCKSRVYNTALCTLMLEVYYKALASYKTSAPLVENAIARDDGDIVIAIVPING